LVGDHPAPADEAYWSVQNSVTRVFPPRVVAQAEDDPTSNPDNSVIMQDTCRRKGVSVQRSRISQGGHGFGRGKAGSPAAIRDEAYAGWRAARASTAAWR
ncbi:alpha/beta hydrolase, partial [Erwinia amylovora]|nr:alpha/beta hydrolase [Erwinia amylovora]